MPYHPANSSPSNDPTFVGRPIGRGGRIVYVRANAANIRSPSREIQATENSHTYSNSGGQENATKYVSPVQSSDTQNVNALANAHPGQSQTESQSSLATPIRIQNKVVPTTGSLSLSSPFSSPTGSSNERKPYSTPSTSHAGNLVSGPSILNEVFAYMHQHQNDQVQQQPPVPSQATQHISMQMSNESRLSTPERAAIMNMTPNLLNHPASYYQFSAPPPSSSFHHFQDNHAILPNLYWSPTGRLPMGSAGSPSQNHQYLSMSHPQEMPSLQALNFQSLNRGHGLTTPYNYYGQPHDPHRPPVMPIPAPNSSTIVSPPREPGHLFSLVMNDQSASVSRSTDIPGTNNYDHVLSSISSQHSPSNASSKPSIASASSVDHATSVSSPSPSRNQAEISPQMVLPRKALPPHHSEANKDKPLSSSTAPKTNSVNKVNELGKTNLQRLNPPSSNNKVLCSKSNEKTPKSQNVWKKSAKVDQKDEGKLELQNSSRDKEKQGNTRMKKSTTTPANLIKSPSVSPNVYLKDLALSLFPPPTTFEKREGCRRKLDSLIKKHWPDGHVELFGSSISLLCEEKSDCDFSVILPPSTGVKQSWFNTIAPKKKFRKRKTSTGEDENSEGETHLSSDDDEHAERDDTVLSEPLDPNAPIEPGVIIQRLATILEEEGYTEIMALPRARVPIVKFHCAEFGLNCDMGMNNFLAIRNSALVRAYVSFDERARELAYLIKYWTRNRKINDPYRGTLSSYSYILLLIHFLQTRKPPVLPCLQTLNRKKDEVEMVNGFDCWFAKGVGQNRMLAHNKATIADLLTDFFKYYAHEFQYRQDVVSIRRGKVYPKGEAHWETSGKKDFTYFLIEDPFETTHNLGRICTKNALFAIRGEFMRGYKLMTGVGRPVQELFEEYVEE